MGVDSNPWNTADWNLTAQAEYVKLRGPARAAARARDAGSELGARIPPTSMRRYLAADYVFREIVED